VVKNPLAVVVDGVTYRPFTCSYRHKGSEWTIKIMAEDFADAEARLAAIHFATVDGEVFDEIPWSPTAGLYVRLLCWWRNRFRVQPDAMAADGESPAVKRALEILSKVEGFAEEQARLRGER
jgi:hypothetical protein